MSETKTGVKIPVGWLRLDRGVTTLPGDWYWDGFKWMPVCRRKSVSDSPMVIRRCRYRVGERVVVWKLSGYSPEVQVGLATIKRVYASDHRGVQSVSLLPTGQPSRDSGLNSCNSDILAPVLPIWSDFRSVPDEWEAQDIINKIDPTNDPNVAPYLASETIYEAPDLSTMGVEVVSEIEPPTVRAVTGALRPFKIGETVYVNDPASVWHYRVGKIIAIDGSFAPYKVEFNFQDGNARWKTSSAWFQPDKIVLGGVAPQPDHGSDANKMTDAPYLASETIDEALQQAELTEDLQADSWAPLVGDWVIRSGGKVSRVSAVEECIDGRVFYALDDTSTKFDRNCLKPYDPRVGDQVVVLKKGSSLQGKPAKVLQVSSTGIHVESLCKTMGALLNPCDLLVELPAKTHDSDHSADTDKMVEMPVIEQSLITPKPKTLYIAGPMRGIAYFNYPMFDRIAGVLREQGLCVISPADEDRKQDGFDPFENPAHAVPENCTFPRTMDFHKIVRRCLDAVLQCEEIVLLPGWERSSGAVAELTLAMWLNKRVRHVRIDEDNQVSFVCFWKGLQSLAVDLYDEYLTEADEPGDLVGIDDDEEADDILEEALKITRGSRNASYGPPDQDFRRTAGMWSALFAAKLREGETFEPRDVALAMILLKTSRETHQRKRDNWVDIAGYARCGSLCN